jgi:hypothetical protein
VVVLVKAQRGASVLSKTAAVDDVGTNKALGDLKRQLDAKRSIMDGARILEDVALTTGSWARIAHGLGRRPRGYFVARTVAAPGAAYAVYDDNNNRTDGDRFLYLRTVGSDVTVDLVAY